LTKRKPTYPPCYRKHNYFFGPNKSIYFYFVKFEWAWQNPQRTRRLKRVVGTKNKKTKESYVAFCFRILSELLRVGPWNRLPLTIRWLIQDYKMEFDPCRQPPVHMPIAYGPLATDKPKKKKVMEDDDVHMPMYQSKRCVQCSGRIEVV
jgi:hypothetical protein